MTDITEPTSEHAPLILRGLWPSASESAWREFAHECLALAAQLAGEEDAQTYVATVLGESAGALIDSLQKLLTTSTSTLAQRIHCYRGASGSAEVIAAQIYAAKVEMTEAVDNAERVITAAREELKPKIEAAQAAGLAAVAGGYTAELLARTQAALASAQAEVATTSATAVASIETAAALPSPAAMPSPHAGSTGAPATSPPAITPHAIPADYVAQPAKYGTNLDGDARQSPERGTGEHRNALNDPNSHQDRPRLADTTPESKPYTPSTVGSGSPAGGSPSSASGSPGGGLGSMMKPLSPAASSGGSPASAGSPASGAGAGSPAGGRPTGAPAAGSSGSPVPQSPVPVGAPATPSRVSTGLGLGIAESAGRLGGGAINAAAAAPAGVPGAAANAVTTAASSTAPAIPGGGGGGPAGGGVPPVIAPAPAPPAATASSPVVGPASAGGPGPVSSTTPASNTPTSAPSTTAAGQASQHDSGPEFLPVILPMSPLTGLDQSASPQAILERATEVGRSIITTMIAQTRATGYLGIDWAASIIWERTGEISAWLASSEGPSYIPLGMRVPDAVQIAVSDAAVGRELATSSAAGASPLEVLTKHMELRDAISPGGRMLVLAGSDPADLVSAWAAATGARPVAVAASLADPQQFDGGQHRCQAAMPWEWNQAQSLAESERMRIAERNMLMAITAGHLNDPIYEDVSRLFQLQKPISDSIWAGLQQQWNDAIVAYQLEQQNAGLGGADPLRQFITARAAELMLCLQHADTADGCADILYLARLAGIPYQSTPGISCSP